MTRVEEKAIDAWVVYEYREHPKGLYHTCFVDGYKEGYEQAEKDLTDVAQFSSGPDGFFYGKGYQQAEKDLALTWEDMRSIHHIAEELKEYLDVGISSPFGASSEAFYTEVLREFKEEQK